MTRVLVVPKWYPSPERPVFGIFCRQQARALATAHDVVVLASEAVRRPGFTVFELSEAVEDGLVTLRVRYRRPAFRPAAMACQIAGMLVALVRLRRRGWRPDVVHAHVYSAGPPALLLGRLSRAPVVITEHYTGYQRGLMRGYDRLVARFALRHADLVAAVSRDLAAQIRALQPRARAVVVPNVVDASVFHPGDSTPPQAGRLLTVASLAEKKGHADLLAALAELRRRHEVTLELVGEGDQRGALEAQAERLGVSDAVRFRGELAPAQVAELMRASDLFVLPSHFENLPCVLLEAMASGLPYVATAVGGVPELDGGTLVPSGDPPALAAAVATALQRPPGADRAELAARAQREYGFPRFAGTWSRLYEQLLNPGGEAPPPAAPPRSGHP